MQLEERQIAISELQPGMFVSRLDRPWGETPFPLQGFLIRGDEDIRALAQYSRHVFIDVELSEPAQRPQLLRLVPGSGRQASDAANDAPLDDAAFQHDFERAVESTRPTFTNFTEQASDLLDALRDGASVDQAQVDALLTPVVAAVTRNQDAYFWLMVLKRQSDYAYQHATNCCALAIAFGRALSFSELGLKSLARGGLLMDIGMASVATGVVDRPGILHASQMAVMRNHVEEGVRRFDAAGLVDAEARSMLASHHEAFDGSGYPRKLVGSAIPLPARIASMVDAYDAMTSDRPYRAALSRAAALQELYRGRGRQFQPELVEEFVRCLGVYPVGTLVELTTGEVGIIVAQNTVHRLRPRLMLLTHPDKTLRDRFVPLNLLGTESTAEGERLSIVRSLPAHSHGLDPTELFL